jgi:hypothetical protein
LLASPPPLLPLTAVPSRLDLPAGTGEHGTSRSYLYTAFPPAPGPATRTAAPAVPAGANRGNWAARPARHGARLLLVAATLVVAIVVPLSESARQGDRTADMWPTQSLTGSFTMTTPGATVGTGVRLAADTNPVTGVTVDANYGGGTLRPIPASVLAAYQRAATETDATFVTCNLDWSLLAAIGEIESGHAASGGSLRPGWNGVANPPILGPVLDGTHGSARIADTDDGKLDGDTHYDRAVGPMQFLPSTWATFGVDGNGDGRADPQNIDDSAATAGRYLCDGGVDLSDPLQLAQAVNSYNHAGWYVRAVMAAAVGYLAESYGRSQEAVAQASIAFAYARLGDPYQFGGTGPRYDCSGLTQAAYASAGITIPRTSEEQWQALPHVDLATLQAGDLVFFNPGEFVAGLPGHVGIYLGHGYMVDDPHTGAFVRIEPIAGFGTLVGAARPSLLVPSRGAPAPGSNLVINVAPPAATTGTVVPAQGADGSTPTPGGNGNVGTPAPGPSAPSKSPATATPAPTYPPTTGPTTAPTAEPTPTPTSSADADRLAAQTQAHRIGPIPMPSQSAQPG